MRESKFKPIKKPHNNTWYSAGECWESLSATRGDDGTINSVWVLASFWERVKFLFKGELTLTILSRNQPPVAIVAGDIFDGRKG